MLLPYGTSHIRLSLECSPSATTLSYQDEPAAAEPAILVQRALAHPSGGKRLRERAIGRQRAVILISDKSRLCPSYLFLPALLRELNDGGIPDDRIRIVVALGLHRKQTESELAELVGVQVYDRVTVVNHSALPEDCVYVGSSSRGTPFEINRLVVEADLLIATGNIEPHRLVGVSGGVKALVPGAASKQTIEAHHALSQSCSAVPGESENALHRDLEDIVRHVPIHFIFNVVVNHRREIVEAFAGTLTAAHPLGVGAAKRRFFIPVDRRYDIVIASPGGHPKDSQLYQTVKTMQNAAAFVKPDGILIVLARCEEQFGNASLQHWIETIGDRDTMIRQLNRQFVLGAHKLLAIAEVLSTCTVYLLSDMPAPLVELAGFHPIADLNATLRQLVGAGGDCEIAVMPYGALTFPLPRPGEGQG